MGIFREIKVLRGHRHKYRMPLVRVKTVAEVKAVQYHFGDSDVRRDDDDEKRFAPFVSRHRL